MFELLPDIVTISLDKDILASLEKKRNKLLQWNGIAQENRHQDLLIVAVLLHGKYLLGYFTQSKYPQQTL